MYCIFLWIHLGTFQLKVISPGLILKFHARAGSCAVIRDFNIDEYYCVDLLTIICEHLAFQARSIKIKKIKKIKKSDHAKYLNRVKVRSPNTLPSYTEQPVFGIYPRANGSQLTISEKQKNSSPSILFSYQSQMLIFKRNSIYVQKLLKGTNVRDMIKCNAFEYTL